MLTINKTFEWENRGFRVGINKSKLWVAQEINGC